jgi:hypothetical protein
MQRQVVHSEWHWGRESVWKAKTADIGVSTQLVSSSHFLYLLYHENRVTSGFGKPDTS